MYEYKTVIDGVIRFIDEDLLPKIPGLNKWLIGTAAGIMANKSEELFKELEHNPLIKSLGIMKDSRIDISCIYKELVRQAEKGEIIIEIPMIGDIKLDHKDVEKLYMYIIED